MKGKEYLEKLPDTKIMDDKVNKVQEVYGDIFSDVVKQIISNSEEGVFLDECRVLSYSEIIYAHEDLGVDFKSMNLIPLFDCFDNDFIVYIMKKDKWAMFNIVDECFFNETSKLNTLIK